MPYKINEKEIAAVSRLAAPQRYEHFLNRAADWQEVWALKGADGFVGMGDDVGNEGIPFWPHPAYAEKHAIGEWADCQPVQISTADFVDKWLPGMARDGAKAIIFPTPEMKGPVVDPQRLLADLTAQLDEYE